MIVNGQFCETVEQLELAIIDFTEAQKEHFREQFANRIVEEPTPIAPKPKLVINGQAVFTEEELEAAILGLPETQQELLRNDFQGIQNPSVQGVPESLTPRQIRIALVMAGVDLTMIDQAIDSMAEPDRSLAKISWEYSVLFERNHPLIESLGIQLGLTIEQIDQMFISGAAI